jgi:hypothetical protein
LYGPGSYARKDYQARITGQVRELAERFGVGRQATPRGREAARAATPPAAPAGPPAAPPAGPPAAPHEQLTLL